MTNEGEDRKPWALLAYTVADDHTGGDPLDAPVKDELKALCDGADFSAISIATQVDFKNIRGVFRASVVADDETRTFEDVAADDYPLWRGIVEKLDRSEMRLQRELTNLNSARGNVVREFLEFGMQECPAERYVVFMYGHSSGPMGLFYDRDDGRHVPNTLRLNDLADSILAMQQRAAVIVFRDCFMGTLETAFQLQGVADFMVASQSLVPIAGIWPWQPLLSALQPDSPPSSVARQLAMQIGSFLNDKAHRGPFADVPISAVDLAAADALVAPLKALADGLDGARADAGRRRACAAALEGARVGYPDKPSQPGDPALVDVLTMCERLQAVESDAVAGPARALADVVGKRLVTWKHSQKDRYRGISLFYMPTAPDDIKHSYLLVEDEDEAAADAACYRQLALSVKTGWDRVALNPLSAL